MSSEQRTGGQYCVTGLVLQLLVGLDHGLRLCIDRTRHDGPVLVAATMILEPDEGGDHDLTTARERVVEQVKIRTTGKAWTAGEIAEDVLPDLIKAVRDDDPMPTRYRLVTDGALNCGTLLTLAQSLKRRPLPHDALAALDDANTRAYSYGRWLSERAYFKALMTRARVNDPLRFWRLLADFEAEGGVTEAQLASRIDTVLGQVVDAHEDVPGKRHEIVSRLATLAQSGCKISATGLLEQAGLPADRLLHRARLPKIMEEGLRRDLAGLGYDAAHDVREVPRAPGRDLQLFSGESGFGKSWRLASLLANQSVEGRLALAVTNARSIEDVRSAIIERIWLSGFDRPIELPALQRRVGKYFTDDRGIWLTVGVDDVQDRSLAVALHTADWQRYGIRIVATVPEQLADELGRRPRPPAEQRVEPFNRAQLRRFLANHGRSTRDLPEDVAELLCIPIFADLYRRGFEPGWRPTNEYELIHGFWRHATFETRGMAESQDDVVALEQAARQLLAPTGIYPWDAEVALAAGLDADARVRLVRTGILRQTAAGFTLTHDRILNWLVARALVADLRHGRHSVDSLTTMLGHFESPEAVAPGLAYRLGYVLLDLLWLGPSTLEPATMHALIEAVLDAPASRINEGPFIEDHLAGLGPAILPALGLMAAQINDSYQPRPIHAARAIATIGQYDPDRAGPIVSNLLTQSDAVVDKGLVAAARMAIPSAVERLWDIHRARRESLDAAPEGLDVHRRHDLVDAAQISLKALRRATKEDCGWIEAKLQQTNDPLSAEILLELLLGAEHSEARDVWLRHKQAFLDRIAAGRTILARAIHRFGDSDEAERLETATENADWYEPNYRFDALLRVAPLRAVEQIDTLPEDLLGRGWFSVHRLVRYGGPDAQPRLLARHGMGWQAMRDLVLTYAHDADLIDVPAFEAVIEALEERMGELAGTPWTLQGEGHLIRFLSKTRRPDLLSLLRARRGSRFERLLCDVAIGREDRSSLCVDRDGEEIERLLLLIGGDGYGELVAHAIASDTVFAREDGYEAAMRLPEGSSYAVGLSTAATANERDQRESYDLMVALATQKLDAPLYELIVASGAAYTDALDIRASLGPMDPAVFARIDADLKSTEGIRRIGATCALAFAPPENLTELMAETLARCPDADESALTVVRMANHLNAYSATMLPQLKRMLALGGNEAREAILPYLAASDDAEARSVAAAHLTAGTSQIVDRCTLKTAFSLSAHEEVSGPGLDRLKLFVDRRHDFYPVGLIAARLHAREAMSNEEVIELAYTAARLSGESSAYLIECVAQFDPEEAQNIAERHFAQSPSPSAARHLLRLGGEAALDHLLQSYLGEERHRVRWIIARAIRRHAGRALTIDRLASWVQGNSVERRLAATTLLAWLPGAISVALLAQMAADAVPEVADAALSAEAQLRSEDHARTLIGELAEADHLGRWARLQAIIDLVDPYLLEGDPDGLQLGEAIDPLGEAIAIGVECMIKARKDRLEKDADRRDREAIT